MPREPQRSISVKFHFSYTEIVLLAEKGPLKELEKRLKQSPKPEMSDIEEAMLVAIRSSNDDCVPLLVVAGARRLDCALYLSIQLERIKAIAILLLCKATINGDTSAIRSLLSEPPESANVPWYMPKVHKVLSQGNIKMSYPIAVSIIEKKYEATKELLLRTDLDMGRKQVDWSKLKLTILDSSWMYSIAPWVVSLKLVNNHLRKLPSEMFSATQLRRLDLSQNLLETVSADLFALPNLEYLSLGHNRLKEVPETSNWSASLLSLDLSENLLSTLPPGIQHSSIEILNLSRNQFTLVPKCLCRIRTLTSLDLSYMPISSLPKEMEHLDHLVNLNVSNANINDLPNGGGVMRGGIRGIFRARARSNKPCNNVKLMLLCHSDVVKTVMLSRLKQHFNSSQLQPHQHLPEIDVFQWSFKPLFTRKVFVSPKLHFNTWLIGSQYSCRSIYPCFFTPGALYVIVWDLTTTADLREQIKAYIDLLVRYVPSANVLVIAVLPEQFEGWNSEKQAEVLAARLNTFFSKPSYQSLSYHGVLMVVANSNTKEGQSDLKQRLYDAAQQMIVNGQHIVGRQVPETYFSLIPVLEKEQQAFRSKCKPGVFDESTIWMQFDRALASDPPDKMELPVMVDFLKEAGFLLHYEDPNDKLDQYYFTQPAWLYNTLLRVIHHALEHRNRLFLTHSELCTLANVGWNKEIAQALIRLMVRYAIVLPTHRDHYLITCLLPHSQPPSDLLYCGMLRRQFAPKVRSLPIDLWSRLLCSIISNLSRIVDVSTLKGGSKSKSRKETDPDTDDETDKHGLPFKKQQSDIFDRAFSDSNLLSRVVSVEGQKEVGDGLKLKLNESRTLKAVKDLQECESVDTVGSIKEEKKSENVKEGEQKGLLRTDDDFINVRVQPPSIPDVEESVLDRRGHPRDFTRLQLTDSVHIEDSSCDNTPVDSPSNDFKPSSPRKKSSPGQLPLNLAEIELERVASPSATGVKELAEQRENVDEDETEIQQTDRTPPSSNRSQKESLKESKEVSPTAQNVASRILRKTSPVKRFSVERSSSPSSSDSSQTPPTSSPPVNGQLQASPRHKELRLQRHSSAPAKKRDLASRRSVKTKPAVIDKGVEIWESGMIYNHKGIKFSIFPCVSEVSTVEERGIEICSTRDNNGYTIMARLCWLVQRNLEERFPHLFSTETALQKHELTQIAICPTCLERSERNPSCFLIEACVHALQLKGEHNCRYHPEAIPLRDLVPDYLLLDFPSHLRLTKTMFDYNEAKPLHRGRQTVLHNGRFNGKEVAIKLYNQVDARSITLPLACVRRESDMLSLLNHPNIVKIFGFCLDPPCVLVEKAPLGNLYQKLMDTEVKISRTVRFHISCQVASALSYLHRRDIIYRTLKASSILLWSLDFNSEASVKLANLERAAYQSPSGLMSKTTFSSYPAPEMLRYSFREEYTEKVDIYSFGILLYELVTRWQPYGGTHNRTHSQKPKLSGVVTTSYSTIVRLMEECWQEEAMARPSANSLLLELSQPSFQCHIASQVLRDCVSVRGCCFVPSVRQIWVYGEYNKASLSGDGESYEGTQVFILNAENLTVQGSLELRERATAMFTVDNKVWIGMTELCVHAYDTMTFRFTDRYHLDDSATIIADNDCHVFIGQANGHLKCYSKLQLQRGDCQPLVVEIGQKAIIAMVTVGDIIWLGCGNELVILSTEEEEVTIERRAKVCESSDLVYMMAVSHNTNTVWCLSRLSHSVTSWDIHTTEKKSTIDLSEHLKWICCELNYDPSFLRMVSIECASDTLWVGLSCGVIMILTDAEQPRKITHFKAHRQATKCLLKIPHSDDLHQQHDHPIILSGGFGEVSSLSSMASEQNGVVMLWHAFTANEFSTAAKRHSRYVQ